MNAITIHGYDLKKSRWVDYTPDAEMCKYVSENDIREVLNTRTHETVRDLMLAGF